MRLLAAVSLVALVSAAAPAAEHPEAEISNGTVRARIYLPDPENGYYRGTRFDWSGAIHSLTHAGHEYFGEWQKSDDPRLHDRITGPVEEYRTAGKGLGYDEAEPGGRFVRIGVGVCRKPAEAGYDWRGSYDVVDPGEWRISRGANWIEFEQAVADAGSGYGYRLRKRLTLTPGRAELVLDHFLENTGRHAIETEVYNHNFFVIDNRPTGPDFAVRFPFAARADREMKGYADAGAGGIAFRREIPAGESVIALIDGWSPTEAADHAFSIENRKTGAGVRMATDRPMSKLQFWAPRTTLCPEPYIELRLAPGEADRWTTRYEFYTLDSAARQ